jgi:predicted small secreted protein
MPRLVGKQSNNGLIATLLLLVAIVAAIGLEYTGAIDTVPGFGRDTQNLRNAPRNLSQHSSEQQSI